MLFYYPNFSREQVLLMTAMYRYRWVRHCQNAAAAVVAKVPSEGQLDLVDLVTAFVDATDRLSEISEVLVYWRRCCVNLESIQVQLVPAFRDKLLDLVNEDYTRYRGTSDASQEFIGRLVAAQAGLRAALTDAPLADPVHLENTKPALPAGITPDTMN